MIVSSGCGRLAGVKSTPRLQAPAEACVKRIGVQDGCALEIYRAARQPAFPLDLPFD
jgi:hypothetical protein